MIRQGFYQEAPGKPAILGQFTDSVGVMGLYLYAWTAWLSPKFSHIALLLCLLAMLLSTEGRRVIISSTPFQLAVAYILFVLLEAYRGLLLFPNSETAQKNGMDEWLILPGFLVLAWWLKADGRRIAALIFGALVSRLIGLGGMVNWHDVLRFQADWQTGFNMTAQTSGLIAASTLLGLFLLLPGLLGNGFKRSRPKQLIRLGIWIIAAYLNLYLLLVSQSRGTWLALLLASSWVVHYQFRNRPSAGEQLKTVRWSLILVTSGVLLLVMIGVFRNADSFMRRTAPDFKVAESILRGEVDKYPKSSFFLRFKVQKFAIEKWLERPLAGWGTGSSRPLIESSGRTELFNELSKSWLGRMHNAYLEILVRFGLVGLCFLGVAFAYAFKSINRAKGQGLISARFWLFVRGSLTILLLWGCTATFTSPAWQGYWVMLMAIGSSYSLVAGYHQKNSHLAYSS